MLWRELANFTRFRERCFRRFEGTPRTHDGDRRAYTKGQESPQDNGVSIATKLVARTLVELHILNELFSHRVALALESRPLVQCVALIRVSRFVGKLHRSTLACAVRLYALLEAPTVEKVRGTFAPHSVKVFTKYYL